MLRRALSIMTAGAILASAGGAMAQDVTLTIESWRNDDLAVWRDKIIPAFEAKHPGIKVIFAPSAPTAYDAALNAKFEAGTAGDIITCRPFDLSLALYNSGRLVDVTNLEGMDNFPQSAKSAWSLDDGSVTYCLPTNSTINGFLYNVEVFNELGLEEPTTEEEFFALLDVIKADGRYIPLAMGTADQWEAATMGYQNIGPTYWKGEEGRLAVIAGTQKLTDEPWVAPFRTLARWSEYLGDGYEARSYPDSQNLFTLGRAAIYPAGSWEIGLFQSQADFEMGAFRAPLPNAGDACVISDHIGAALGVNAASPNKDAAMVFLKWAATEEFAHIYGNALPGIFPLYKDPVTIDNAIANEFLSWRNDCSTTIRSTYSILSRGTPNLENETWGVTANIMNGTMTPEEGAQRLQAGLESWYAPQQGK